MTAKEAHEALLKRDTELKADDFQWGHRVMVHHGDRSHFNLNNAFAEKHGEFWFIFSEHCGCHFFHEEDAHVYQYEMETCS